MEEVPMCSWLKLFAIAEGTSVRKVSDVFEMIYEFSDDIRIFGFGENFRFTRRNQTPLFSDRQLGTSSISRFFIRVLSNETSGQFDSNNVLTQ